MTFPKKFRTKKGLWQAHKKWVVIVKAINEREAQILKGTTHPTYRAGQLKTGFKFNDTDVWEPLFEVKNIKYNLKEIECVK